MFGHALYSHLCVRVHPSSIDIVMARTMLSLVVGVVAACLWSGSSAQEFTLPNGPQARPPVLQVDAEGRAFVANGNQLHRLNRDLVIEQSITLSDNAVNISLSSGGEWLVVCTTDLSCAVHNASNLSAVSPVSDLTLAGTVRGIALFTANNSFYTGSYFTITSGGTEEISMRLTQSSLDGSGRIQRFTNYSNTETNIDGVVTRPGILRIAGFRRDYFSGFVRGNYTYYLVSDHTPGGQQGLTIMRVCHCSGEGMCPSIRVLAEEGLSCGTAFRTEGDGLCGVSVVEDYAGESGTSIVMSRCRPGLATLNLVCLVRLSDVDRVMDMRMSECQENTDGRTEISWILRGPVSTDCSAITINGMCDISLPIGEFLDPNRLPDFIPVSDVIDISNPFNQANNIRNSITASVAVKIDSFSLIVVAYTSTAADSPNFIGIYEITSSAARLRRDNAIVVQSVPSPVRTLQWQSGLDYVLAATDTQIFSFPIEECSSNVTCASCVVNSNPLCGWCVVENKCSRQSLCQNGNSTSSTRWIPSNSMLDVSTRCISNIITPNQFLLDDQQELSVSVGGPGLPALLESEFYFCHLEDGLGRFNITVPAMEVTPGTNYTCNITNEVPPYEGVQAVMDFSFSSSLVNVPFDTTEEALTIHRCNAATSCTECLAMGSACGWCSINKICRGLSDDCINDTEFLQLSSEGTFEDLCPLLDRMDGVSDYTQHVRVATELQLTTRNLPAPDLGFIYMCQVRNTLFEATFNNESSNLTCHITENMLVGLSSSGFSEIADISIQWVNMDQGINHQIDNLNDTRVVLYDCQLVDAECSFCIGTREAMNFQCGYCQEDSRCSVSGECSQSSPFITDGQQCPDHVITGFIPTSGPPIAGIILTITGTNLGVRIEDFGPNSIDVGGVACTPLSEGYIPGASVRCRISAILAEGSRAVTVVLSRNGADVSEKAPMEYMVVRPSLSSVEPEFGPIAGGSMLRLRGTGLDIGNEDTVRVTLDRDGANGNCDVMMGRNATEIRCTTSSVISPSDSPGVVEISIDGFTFTLNEAFSYRSNPNITSVQPPFTIPAGGITLTFSGENLDVSQRPVIRLGQEMILCNANSSSTLTCLAPPVDSSQMDQRELMYTLMFDNFEVRGPSDPDLSVEVRPNPSGFSVDNTDAILIGKSVRLQINAVNLGSVHPDEILVFVGDQPCNMDFFVGESFILCDLPSPPAGENLVFSVTVIVGNLNMTAGELTYIPESTASPTATPISLTLIIPAVVVPVAVVLLCCVVWIIVIICVSSRVSKKKEQQYTNLIAKMELLEYEMADECKRAFTELQTDLADLVQISSDKNLPYRDFRTFAMRFLFPKAGDDHPVLHPLKIQGVKLEEEQAMKHLDSFKELIMNKKFLLVFVHTLESQHSFSLQDKVTVASLLMVAFQNDLDYATDVLQTLLAEMMRKSIAKSHPKLLLRRTETVAEKMLANWLAFLLFPYLLEHVGEPLFILFRAIKSQLEKGPVDVISGEAKNSLSEEKLLRQHLEVKPVEGVVQNDDESDVPIKMWDCDSITQAKEKILDALYRNTPVSKRPQLTAVDLELISKGNNGITLRDQDATNSKDGEWTKINTLGHYKLEDMSKNHIENPKLPIPKFRLVARSDRPLSGISFDTLGTIISNISAANRSSMVMSASELNRTYHLVKPEPEDGDGAGQKIMSEVYLTRLLSTKRILQPYVDKLFESIFDVPHGKVLPKAIKCLFDFLDLQASELGITDSEVLHSWKTNSVPLRFWVNVIKNPDFVFDINKSATVDSCLTVIAQAYIDATSTADIKYTKDTPSARLLYVNEVKKYKAGVENYYSSVQALPKLSNGDMAEYLRDTAQVCANSVKQYDPTVVNDPALMTRKLYFVTESALYELFKVASEHSDDIIDALNEEGLTIPAAQFDQIRKALAS